jgi:hypothetical protein
MSLNFSIDLILPAALWPGVDSASNRNEYQESSWGLNGGRRVRLTLTICEPVVLKIRESRRLTTVCASTACYRDSFTFSIIITVIVIIIILKGLIIAIITVVRNEESCRSATQSGFCSMQRNCHLFWVLGRYDSEQLLEMIRRQSKSGLLSSRKHGNFRTLNLRERKAASFCLRFQGHTHYIQVFAH